MGVIRSVEGIYRLKIISASPAEMLAAVNTAGIQIENVEFIDDLCIRASIHRSDYRALYALIIKRGDNVVIEKREGLFWLMPELLKRPVLLLGILLLLVLALYLPTRVLFISVEGNSSIPSQYIIEQADRCGISFGASRRAVRSERMKNMLLSEIPQLQWAGVNTVGCVAVISVRERASPDIHTELSRVSSIIASRDGILREITAIRGNLLCKEGQAVKKGQVLISGYTDCGFSISAERAEGEIVAQTFRKIQAVTPIEQEWRGEIFKERTNYALRIGKNIINFLKDSGISDTTCAKIYEEYHLTLPGGLQLPVVLLKTKYIFSSCDSGRVDNEDRFLWMKDGAESYLCNQMYAGQILKSNERLEFTEDMCVLTGRYICSENIGQVRYEELYKNE